MVNEGMMFFNSMEKAYGLVPGVEHACVVDFLGRSGRIKEAEQFVLDMPIGADSAVWGTLLSACWFSKELEEGESGRENAELGCNAHIIVHSHVEYLCERWEDGMEVRKRLMGAESEEGS